MSKTYTVSRFADVEQSADGSWAVVNRVTGIAHETTYPSYKAARDAALHVGLHYRAIERKAGW